MAIEGEEPAHAIGADPDPFLGEEEEHVNFEADNESVPDDDSDDWLCEMEEMAAAAITPESNSTAVRIELFDSGATRHISPYRDDFTTYSLLTPPLLLNTANQQRFQAIGTGLLTIKVPNGSGENDLTLHNTLHAPSVAYTLVSLGNTRR